MRYYRDLVAWYVERYRARRAAWRADLDLRRSYTPTALRRQIHAAEHLRRVEYRRPWLPKP
jgi:hypothetical protein